MATIIATTRLGDTITGTFKGTHLPEFLAKHYANYPNAFARLHFHALKRWELRSSDKGYMAYVAKREKQIRRKGIASTCPVVRFQKSKAKWAVRMEDDVLNIIYCGST
jgi:hypothetical protein